MNQRFSAGNALEAARDMFLDRQRKRTNSCPATFTLPVETPVESQPETPKQRLLRPAADPLVQAIRQKCECKRRSLRKSIPDAPMAPTYDKSQLKTAKGIDRSVEVINAVATQYMFKNLYAFFRRPFRHTRRFREINDMLTLICFLLVNLLPVQIFAFTIFADYMWFSGSMATEMRSNWLNCLYWGTWGFVIVYSLNIFRLATVMMAPLNNWWLNFLDWEGMMYINLLNRFWSLMKYVVEWLWESYHQKTWEYIYGIQAVAKQNTDAVQFVADEHNLPKDVANTIESFLNVEGINELDYRWYLHDNRRNLKNIRRMNYQTRECIASFLIPEPAFKMDKDAIVSLFCDVQGQKL